MFRLFIVVIGISVSISGCASLTSFKNRLLHVNAQPIQPVKKVSISAPKTESETRHSLRAPSHNCSYIVRDLSVPNATAVWCIPKSTQ